MVNQQTLNKCKQLCKNYNIKYQFTNSIYSWSEPYNEKIFIAKGLDDIDFVTMVFHEIQHVLNWRNKKYYAYHKKNPSRKDWKRWSLIAEVYTDKQAKKLAATHGFHKYTCYYQFNDYYRNYLNTFNN